MTCVGAFISANFEVIIVVEAFAIRVLGALCLALIHGPTVKGLSIFPREALADAEISTDQFRNAVRVGNLLPLAIVGALVSLKRIFAPTPVAVTFVEFFQCAACQLVSVRPKCAAVSKAAILLCTCIRLFPTNTGSAITVPFRFQIAAGEALLTQLNPVVAAATTAIGLVKTTLSSAGNNEKGELPQQRPRHCRNPGNMA